VSAVLRALADIAWMRRSSSKITACSPARRVLSWYSQSVRWRKMRRCSAPSRATAFLRLAEPLTLRETERW